MADSKTYSAIFSVRLVSHLAVILPDRVAHSREHLIVPNTVKNVAVEGVGAISAERGRILVEHRLINVQNPRHADHINVVIARKDIDRAFVERAFAHKAVIPSVVRKIKVRGQLVAVFVGGIEHVGQISLENRVI